MVRNEVREQLPDIREFVKEHGEAVYNFCLLTLSEPTSVGTVLESVFSRFIRVFPKLTKKQKLSQEQLKIYLYRLAWEELQKNVAMGAFPLGESTKGPSVVTQKDADLFEFSDDELDSDTFSQLLQDRLMSVDYEFRAPLILRDILGFEDEEICQILSCRWGVYRHRLHRGRMDFVDFLHGSRRESSSSQAETTQ